MKDVYILSRKLHLWLSVPIGLITALICISGFILLVEPAHDATEERSKFFVDVMRLHRWLFDSPPEKGMMTSGKFVVGISTIAFILIILTGIVMWSQKIRGGFWKSLRIHYSHGFNSFCSTFHSTGGVYAALFILIMAITGLTWSFSDFRQWFYALFDIEKGSHIVYEIHTGKIGGVTTKIIWGISVLIGFTLPATGYYIWLKKLIKRTS